MKKNNLNFYFYSFILIINLIAGAYSVYFLKFKGGFDPEFLASVYNAGPSISSIQENRYYQKAKLSFLQGDLRESSDYFEKFKRDIEHIITNNSNILSFKGLDATIQEVAQEYGELVSRPQAQGPLKILHEKLNSFEHLAKSRHWPTLTSLAARTSEKVSNFSEKASSMIPAGRLLSFANSIENDFTRIREIIAGSVLNASDKKLVETLIDQMHPEVEALITFHKNSEGLKFGLDKLESAVDTWAKESTLNSSDKKIELQNLNHKAINYLIAFILFTLGSFFIGALLFKYISRQQKISNEKNTLDLIKRGILSQGAFESAELAMASTNFVQSFNKLREYTQRRIAFGSLVQDGIPFGALLFDSNLNVVWVNSIFFEQLNLVGNKDLETNMSWDFILKFTNISHEDPIKLALQNNMPGIYQIKVRPLNAEESTPYEMYVTPIEYSAQKKVMVFFYPLKAMEETLNQQLKGLTGPINKMLDIMLNPEEKQAQIQMLQNDFEISGIQDIYFKFEDICNHFINQRNDLCSEVEKIENELCDEMKVKSDLLNNLNQSLQIQTTTIESFKEIKKVFINLAYARSELEKQTHAILSTLRLIGKENKVTGNELLRYRTALESNLGVIKSLAPLKDQVKKTKKVVDSHKSEVVQSLDHVFLFRFSFNF